MGGLNYYKGYERDAGGIEREVLLPDLNGRLKGVLDESTYNEMIHLRDIWKKALHWNSYVGFCLS